MRFEMTPSGSARKGNTFNFLGGFRFIFNFFTFSPPWPLLFALLAYSFRSCGNTNEDMQVSSLPEAWYSYLVSRLQNLRFF